MNSFFWSGKKVFLTGHTGFKGTWMSLLLTRMGADVTGYALPMEEENGFFSLSKANRHVRTFYSDIRNYSELEASMLKAKPDIIIHLAAQPLVRESYHNPVDTYEINVMGTVNLLESVRKCDSVKAIVNVTTDKCYENNEWIWGYRETDSLGGFDPYSNSKACSEFVTNSYRDSFFSPKNYSTHGVAIASARAGNVIGGGDWAKDRLIPDSMKAIYNKEIIDIRNPTSTRPWQHVLEPLSGYLLLAEQLYNEGPQFGGAWNFGPRDEDAKTVEWIVRYICNSWKEKASYRITGSMEPLHEATYLKLDWTKAKQFLKWEPKWHIETALDMTMTWFEAYFKNKEIISHLTMEQIENYFRKII